MRVTVVFVAVLVVGGIFSSTRPEAGSFAASAWSGLEPAQAVEPTEPVEPAALEMPSSSPTVTATASPATGCTIPVDAAPTGRLVAGQYAGESAVTVEVEDGLALDPDCVAGVVTEALSLTDADLTVTVASTEMVGRLCAPLDTTGVATCWNGSRALVDVASWTAATPEGRADLIRDQVETIFGADPS